MIGEVDGCLGHVPAVAGRAGPEAFAREGHDESLAAARAANAGKADTEQPALEIAAEFILNGSRAARRLPPLKLVLAVADYPSSPKICWMLSVILLILLPISLSAIIASTESLRPVTACSVSSSVA